MDHPDLPEAVGTFARLLSEVPEPFGLAATSTPTVARLEVVRTATAVLGRARVEPSAPQDRVLWGTVHSPGPDGAGGLAGLVRMPIRGGATTATVALELVERDVGIPRALSSRARLVADGRVSGKLWPIAAEGSPPPSESGSASP